MKKQTRTDDVAAIGLLDEPMRRRLYEWVVGQDRPVGREEAARALHITRPLATFHLDRLAGGGLLDAGYQRLTGRVGPGAGRPARVYWRADREFSVTLPERRYQRAAQLFLSALEKMADGEAPPPLLDAAEELGEELGGASRATDSERRLTTALERGGYEPHPDQYGTIRLRNCPFDALAVDHRTLVCSTNLALGQGLVRGAGVDDMHPVLDPQPGYCCVAFVPDATD